MVFGQDGDDDYDDDDDDDDDDDEKRNEWPIIRSSSVLKSGVDMLSRCCWEGYPSQDRK